MLLLDVFFLFAKCLLIIPSHNEKYTILNKVYGILMLVIITVLSLMVTDTKIRVLSKIYIHIKIVVSILIHFNLLLFNYNLVLQLFFWKRLKWSILSDQLRLLLQTTYNWSSQIRLGQVRTNKQLKIFKMCISCILVLILQFLICTCAFSFWVYVHNLNLFIYNVVFFQHFSIMAYNVYIVFILQILLFSYKKLRFIMDHMTTFDVNVLINVENSVFFLKSAVDNFNDLFSWSLFLNISFTVLFTLNNLDSIFAASTKYTDLIFWRIAVDTIMIALIYVHYHNCYILYNKIRKSFIDERKV